MKKHKRTKILKEHPAGIPDYKPRFGFYEFGESSINFYIRIGAKRFVNHYSMKSQFIKNLHKRFNKEGIIIPYPIRTVYMHKEK